jgi:uncharacterized protein involved in exopolysaccharide biosynthesis
MDPFLDETAAAKPGFDLGMLWRAFWRRKLLFVVPLLLCLTMAAVVIETMTPLYRSQGLIELRMDHMRSQLLADPSQAFGRQRDIERRIQGDMMNLLMSPSFLDRMVAELDLAPAAAQTPAQPGVTTGSDRAAVRLRSKVQLNRVNSAIYEVAVTDTDPREAYRLARHVTVRFVEEYRLARLAARNSTREFLESQRKRYEQDLDAAERALNEYLADMAASDLVGSRLHAGNIAATEERIERVRMRHEGPDATEFDELARAARRILGSDPPVSVYARDGVIKSLLLELEDLGGELMTTAETDGDYGNLEVRLGRLRVQMSDRVDALVAANHPRVALMDRNRLVNYYYSYLYRSVELQVLRQAQRNVAEYRRFVTQRPIQSAQLAELQERVNGARDLLGTIDSEIRQQQMNLDAGMSDVGMQIMVRQQPVLRMEPVEPNGPKLWFMGVVLSVAMGLGLVVLAIFLDKSFRTVEDIEHVLGVSVIGTLPVIQDEHFVRKRRLRLLRWLTIIVAVVAVAAVAFLVVYPMLSR